MNGWDELEKNIESCTRCIFSKNRKNVVIGRGNKTADLMMIGEAPGEQEDIQGRAFVGKAGQLLSMALSAMGMVEKDYYICNIIKCRPHNNRTPAMDEMLECKPFLDAQIELVKPKVIILLGNAALNGILDKDARISKVRGSWSEYKKIPVTMTYHPAALLRDGSKKIEMWTDIKNAWLKLKMID